MMESKIQTCCKKPYPIVFVDLNMPIMGGIEMMEALLGVNSELSF